MTNRELEELIVKADDIRRSIARLIKEERKKARHTGPAIGQAYWFTQISRTDTFKYDADDFDLDVFKFRGGYPEERFAKAELRAMKLIQAVNKRRRELNERKVFGDRKYYIAFTGLYGLGAWGHPDQAYARGDAYPFGLFQDSADCETCIHEFKDELKWFFKEYLPLMEELDDYDWAEAPGWGGEV